MTIKSKQLFILIGDNNTGKTTIQKFLIEKLCTEFYDRLPSNIHFNIVHPEIKRKYQDLFVAGRSYQERIEAYGTVDEYFTNRFTAADISVISSHLDVGQITEMIRNGRERFYNVTGIFFSNSIQANTRTNSQISLLDWDERQYIENPHTDNETSMDFQLQSIADNLITLIANRTSVS